MDVIKSIIDDLWMNVFDFLDVQSFISICHTCNHFLSLLNETNGQTRIRVKRFWKRQSMILCCDIGNHNYESPEWRQFYIELRHMAMTHKDFYTSTCTNQCSNVSLVFSTQQKNRNSLYLACRDDCPLVFDMIFKLKHCIKTINSPLRSYEENALHRACEYGSVKMVKYLLLNYENINVSIDLKPFDYAVFGVDATPLIVAVKGDYYNIVEMLLSHPEMTRENINFVESRTDNSLNNAVYCAFFYQRNTNNDEQFKMGKLLIKKHDADINIKYPNEDGNTMLHLGVYYYHLAKKDNSNKSDNNCNKTQPFDVWDYCDSDNTGGGVDWPSFKGLDQKEYWLSVIKFLVIECSDIIDINAVNNMNETPLMMACTNNDCEIVELLLTQGKDLKKAIDVNVADKHDKMTSLMICANKGYIECLKLLLKHGKCDLKVRNSENFDCMNVFMIAVENGNVEMVKIIFHHVTQKWESKDQIDEYINSKDASGQTAYDIAHGRFTCAVTAQERGIYREMMKVLVEHCNVKVPKKKQ